MACFRLLPNSHGKNFCIVTKEYCNSYQSSSSSYARTFGIYAVVLTRHRCVWSTMVDVDTASTQALIPVDWHLNLTCMKSLKKYTLMCTAEAAKISKLLERMHIMPTNFPVTGLSWLNLSFNLCRRLPTGRYICVEESKMPVITLTKEQLKHVLQELSTGEFRPHSYMVNW